MTLPDTEDLLLFGSLGLSAIGAALIVGTTTADITAAIGTALVVFGLPAFIITLLAAGEQQ